MAKNKEIVQQLDNSEFEESYFKDLHDKNIDLKAKGTWQKMYAYYMDLIFKVKGKKIVDLGCAYGSISSAFADYNTEVIGVDISKVATTTSPFKNIKLINTPAWDLSKIEDNSIDFVHSMYMFEFIPMDKRDKLFSEITRICKPDALVFVILNMGIPKKNHPTNMYLSQKYEWDEIAAKYGMLDGARAYYSKLMETKVPGWEFMAKYNWPFLCYKVVKKVTENVTV